MFAPWKSAEEQLGNKHLATGLAPLPALEAIYYDVPGCSRRRLIPGAPPARRASISRFTDLNKTPAAIFLFSRHSQNSGECQSDPLGWSDPGDSAPLTEPAAA